MGGVCGSRSKPKALSSKIKERLPPEDKSYNSLVIGGISGNEQMSQTVSIKDSRKISFLEREKKRMSRSFSAKIPEVYEENHDGILTERTGKSLREWKKKKKPEELVKIDEMAALLASREKMSELGEKSPSGFLEKSQSSLFGDSPINRYGKGVLKRGNKKKKLSKVIEVNHITENVQIIPDKKMGKSDLEKISKTLMAHHIFYSITKSQMYHFFSNRHFNMKTNGV